MWKLDPLVVDDYRKHLDVAFPVDAVPETVSEVEKSAVLELYKVYKQTLGRPSAELIGEDIGEESLQSLHDAYDLVQDGRRLRTLRSELKLLADLCPYCGYGPIEELDHLLQRKHYKALSIFALNLVPSCGACNRGKRKNPSADPNKHQIHVYLEDVSKFDFLRADVSVNPDTGGLQVRYFIEQGDGMSDEMYLRLAYHLEEFDLQARYEKQVNIYLGALEYSISSSYAQGGAAGLKGWLAGNAESMKKQKWFGVNDYRTALMRGLSECPAFYEGGFETALGLRK